MLNRDGRNQAVYRGTNSMAFAPAQPIDVGRGKEHGARQRITQEGQGEERITKRRACGNIPQALQDLLHNWAASGEVEKLFV